MEEQIVEALPTPPMQYAGKWIAYDAAKSKIIAAGDSFEEAYEAAHATGEEEPVFRKVPRGTRYVDGKFR